ncbi:MAG: hypothetical protein B7Z44_11540, partial [Caulobacter sp. 12-67-6]
MNKVALRGRGARTNDTSRFETFRSEAFEDGWTEADEAARPLTTTIQPMKSKTIIARNDSPDISFSRS